MTLTDKIVLTTVRVGYRTPHTIQQQTGLTPAAIAASLDALQKRAHEISKRRPLVPACIVRRGVDSPDVRDQLLYPEPPLTVVGAP